MSCRWGSEAQAGRGLHRSLSKWVAMPETRSQISSPALRPLQQAVSFIATFHTCWGWGGSFSPEMGALSRLGTEWLPGDGWITQLNIHHMACFTHCIITATFVWRIISICFEMRCDSNPRRLSLGHQSRFVLWAQRAVLGLVRLGEFSVDPFNK